MVGMVPEPNRTRQPRLGSNGRLTGPTRGVPTLFRRAIVRAPGPNFAEGLTTVNLGVPDTERALAQHAAYCEALERCGLALTRLPADVRHADATFVEDTAVLTPRGAILTRPGAASRAGEVEAIRGPLAAFYRGFRTIEAPGTLDGGDVCEAEGLMLIGISARTNEAGAGQLAALMEEEGIRCALVDIREVTGRLLFAAGHPKLDAALRRLGYDLLPLEMSEFQKMDGGLSCLSLRF